MRSCFGWRGNTSRSSSRLPGACGSLTSRQYDQLVPIGHALEDVLAIKDAGLEQIVRITAIGIEDAQAEVAVDRGAADEHRQFEPARVQLLHTGGHLLRGRNEESAQADRRGVVLHRGI